MKLILQNFRCFKNLSLSLPFNGTVLIWGTSGIGKSTILKAIHFALYGKEQKVIKHGEKKCKVELIFDDTLFGDTHFSIIRTRCPNHLTFVDLKENSSIEDDVAQAKINQLFGTHFLLTSYMAQKGTENFFYLSNTEKASFLQKLSFKEFDIELYRKKVKETIRKRKDKLIELSTEKKVVQEQINRLSKISEPLLKLDLKGKTFEDFVSYEEQLREKNKLSIKQISDELQSKITEKEKFEKLSNRKDILTALHNDKILVQENLEKTLNSDQYKNIHQLKEFISELDYVKRVQKYFILRQKTTDTKKEYETLVQAEQKRVEDSLQSIQEKITQIEPDILTKEVEDEYRSTLQSYNKLRTGLEEYTEDEITMKTIDTIYIEFEESLNDDKKRLQKYEQQYSILQTRIQDIKAEEKTLSDTLKQLSVDQKIRDKSMKCPGCKIHFYIEQNNVIQVPDNLEELKKKVKEITSKLATITESKLKLEKDFKTIQTKLDDVKITLDVKTRDIDTLKPLYNLIKSMDFDPEIVNRLLQKHDSSKSKYEVLIQELKQTKQKIQMFTNEKGTKEEWIESLPKHIQQKRNLIIQYKDEIYKQKNDLEHQTFDISDYLDENEESICEEKINELEHTIQQLLIYKKEKETIQKQLEELYKDIDLINEELSTLIGINDYSSQTEIAELKEKLEKKKTIEETLQKRKEKIERYIIESEKFKEYQTLNNQLVQAKEEEKIFERALIKAETMFKLINDAETLSLQNTVDNINIELQEYITAFFGENVSAELITYKEGKDGEKKSSIDVSIIKDGESISLDSLSGGEFDRIALALFLAFNKVSNSKLIILDECLSSLHSELVEEIVEMIKTKLNHKLVLFTLHQANTGMFSEIVDVEQYRCCS